MPRGPQSLRITRSFHEYPAQLIANDSINRTILTPNATVSEPKRTARKSHNFQPKKSKRKSTVPKHIQEIRYYQNVTHNLIPKLPFSRLVREIIQNNKQYKISQTAFEALQEAAEMYLSQFFEDAYRCCLHRSRVTLSVNDMQLVSFLRGVRDPGCT